MNRRGFLKLLAASLTLDPERALRVPGKKLISIPAPADEIAVVTLYSIYRGRLVDNFFVNSPWTMYLWRGLQLKSEDLQSPLIYPE